MSADRVTAPPDGATPGASPALGGSSSQLGADATGPETARPTREPEIAERVRVRYAKTGKLRFISAIDLGRIWERALRKANLPIAYSEGFSPHPKVSFPDALPLGYASTGEYAELRFGAPIAVGPAMRDLNAAFVEGCEVLDAVGVADGDPRLAKWLSASLWQIDYPHDTDIEALADAARALRDATELPVGRERKGKTVDIDLRPYVHDLACSETCVRVVLLHGEPPVRPTEVQAALAADRIDAAGRCALPEPTHITRVAQGAPAADGVHEAISGDRVALRASPAP